jgi:hypothetical protein
MTQLGLTDNQAAKSLVHYRMFPPQPMRVI